METFKVVAKREDNYVISIDPEQWNEEYLANWSSVFHKVYEVKDIVENLSFQILRFGSTGHYEGYGYVKTFASDGRELIQTMRGDDGSLVVVTERDYCKGISVTIIDEDEEYEFEIEEVTDEQ